MNFFCMGIREICIFLVGRGAGGLFIQHKHCVRVYELDGFNGMMGFWVLVFGATGIFETCEQSKAKQSGTEIQTFLHMGYLGLSSPNHTEIRHHWIECTWIHNTRFAKWVNGFS